MKNRTLQRIVTWCLVFVMVFAVLPVMQESAGAQPQQPGNMPIIPGVTVPPSPIVTYTREVDYFWSDDYIYTVDIAGSNGYLNPRVRAIYAGTGTGTPGGFVLGVQSPWVIAQNFQNRGYNVIGGINTGFYITGNGTAPNNHGLQGMNTGGLMMSHGEIVRCADIFSGTNMVEGNSDWAFGINRDGSFVHGRSPTTITSFTVNGGVTSTPIDRINHRRPPESWTWRGVTLLTDRFAATTNTMFSGNYQGDGGTDVRLRILSGRPAPNSSMVAEVVQVRNAPFGGVSTTIGAGHFVLSANSHHSHHLSGLVVGDIVTMDFAFDNPEWNDADFSVNAVWPLVLNGQPVSGTNLTVPGVGQMTTSFANGNRARTAVGVRADGSMFWTVVDEIYHFTGGFQNTHPDGGMTMREIADYKFAQGAVIAYYLDGGGSSSMTIGTQMVNRGVDPAGFRSLGAMILLVEAPALSGVSRSVSFNGEHIGNFTAGSRVEIRFPNREGFHLRSIKGLENTIMGLDRTGDYNILSFAMPERAVNVTADIFTVPNQGGMAFTASAGVGMTFVNPDNFDVLTPQPSSFTPGQTVVLEIISELEHISVDGLDSTRYSVFIEDGRRFVSFAMPSRNIMLSISRASATINSSIFLAVTGYLQSLDRLRITLPNGETRIVGRDDGVLVTSNNPEISISGEYLTALEVGVFSINISYGADTMTIHVHARNFHDEYFIGVTVIDENFNNIQNGQLPSGWINRSESPIVPFVENGELIMDAGGVQNIELPVGNVSNFTLEFQSRVIRGGRTDLAFRTQGVPIAGNAYGLAFLPSATGDGILGWIGGAGSALGTNQLHRTETNHRASFANVSNAPGNNNVVPSTGISGAVGDINHFRISATGTQVDVWHNVNNPSLLPFMSVDLSMFYDGTAGNLNGVPRRYESGGIALRNFQAGIAINNIRVVADVPQNFFPREYWPGPFNVTGVNIDKNDFSLRIGATRRLTATVEPEHAENRDISWSTDNPNTAIVSADGTITAVSPGQAQITVTTLDGGFTDSVMLTVLPEPGPGYDFLIHPAKDWADIPAGVGFTTAIRETPDAPLVISNAGAGGFPHAHLNTSDRILSIPRADWDNYALVFDMDVMMMASGTRNISIRLATNLSTATVDGIPVRINIPGATALAPAGVGIDAAQRHVGEIPLSEIFIDVTNPNAVFELRGILIQTVAAGITANIHELRITRAYECGSFRECVCNDVIDVDRTALESAIADAQSRNQTDYTEESWLAMQNVLMAAMLVCDDANSTQEQIDIAAKNLQKALDTLEMRLPEPPPIDADLAARIAYVDGLNADDFTITSWTRLQNELTLARRIADNERSTQAQIDTATDRLNAAISGLETPPTATPPADNRAQLQAAVDFAMGLDQSEFSIADWTRIQNELNVANRVLANERSTDAQIATSVSRLDALTGRSNIMEQEHVELD